MKKNLSRFLRSFNVATLLRNGVYNGGLWKYVVSGDRKVLFVIPGYPEQSMIHAKITNCMQKLDPLLLPQLLQLHTVVC